MTMKPSDEERWCLSGTDITRRMFGRMVGAAVTVVPAGRSVVGMTQTQAGAAATAPVGASDSLCELGAFELAASIRRKQVSARDVMTAHLARIARINPKV